MAQDFQTYRLPGLLANNASLVCNKTGSILTLLEDAEIIVQQALLEIEMDVLTALLVAHPGVCSYAALYASLARCPVEEVQGFIQSLDEAWIEVAMKPAQRVLRTCSQTLEIFALGIRPVERTGYQLFRLP